MSVGVYLHIPFCASICNYCNFTRGLLDDGMKARYVRALIADIDSSAEPVAVDTIYFGGGTPSLLRPDEVGSILRAIGRAFEVDRDAEVTLEANPETVDPTTLAAFREAGVTRLSVGVQSFSDTELARLGRRHDASRAIRAVEDARAAGYSNISLDLMMWLPAQSRADWLASVDALVEVAPEHASLYLLEIYPGSPLRDAMARAQWSQAPDDDAADMYLEGLAWLDAAGYVQYEISNVARPGLECRHNLKYWTDGEWLAFGCSAYGTRHGERWRVVGETTDYVRRVEEGRPVVAERRALSPDDCVAEALFMGLRLSAGVDLTEIGRRYDRDPWTRYGEALKPFLDSGHVRYDGARLSLTRPGMLVANEIFGVFV